ncbi:dihydrofolate reductase family protein [Curtobacterium flaccumfaciens]|nr:dihydrofolate reductase family protein [Curtobacterium flaccumfaciens]
MTVLPPSIADLSDDDLLELYTADVGDPWLRVNFVATLDGSASAAGVSGSLGGDDDLRVFDLLRRVADVVLVAAGTVRDEGYGPMVLHDADVAWRRAHGMPDHPVFAIVTGSLSLDPASRVFTEAPVRPIVLTSATAAASATARALAEVADVVPCSADDAPESVDAGRIRGVLADRGLGTIHCEGGPSFLGDARRRGRRRRADPDDRPVARGRGGAAHRPRVVPGAPADATGARAARRRRRAAHAVRPGALTPLG